MTVAGATAENTIGNKVDASIVGSTATATNGEVTLSAVDSSTIISNAGGVGVSVGAGGAGRCGGFCRMVGGEKHC